MNTIRCRLSILLSACAILPLASCQREDQAGSDESMPVGMVVTFEISNWDGNEEIGPSNQLVQSVVDTIDRRLQVTGKRVGSVEQLQGNQIQVNLFESDQPTMERVVDFLQRRGRLELRVLADVSEDRTIVNQALTDPGLDRVFDDSGNLLAWWVNVNASSIEAISENPKLATRTLTVDQHQTLQVLLLNDNSDWSGETIEMARIGLDSLSRPAVDIRFSEAIGRHLHKLSRRNLPVSGQERHLGIVIDDELQSAPMISNVFRSEAQLTGAFTQSEVETLVRLFKAGQLPARIQLVTNSATEGD